VSYAKARPRSLGVWRFQEALPPVPSGYRVSMGEGSTPLIPLERLGRSIGVPRLYAKLEGLNPTGSFKDRGMAVGVSVALLAGAKVVVAASTGNTAASLAAYARRAGLEPLVVVPAGRVASGKLLQALAYGAYIVEVEAGFDEALEAVIEVVEREPRLYPLNSFNPWRLEGQKTLAYEVVEQLGDAPDWVVVPVGNAGNIAAIWKGFKELLEAGEASRAPRMAGVQAEGAAPLAKAWMKGLREPLWVENPETVATAIRIGKPVNWVKAMRAVQDSRGVFTVVTDEEILKAMMDLARLEGVVVEPASAAAVAGLTKLAREGLVARDETVVVVLTGHGLKDPGAWNRVAQVRRVKVKSVGDAVEAILSLALGAERLGA
jgi:threonine synthase